MRQTVYERSNELRGSLRNKATKGDGGSDAIPTVTLHEAEWAVEEMLARAGQEAQERKVLAQEVSAFLKETDVEKRLMHAYNLGEMCERALNG